MNLSASFQGIFLVALGLSLAVQAAPRQKSKSNHGSDELRFVRIGGSASSPEAFGGFRANLKMTLLPGESGQKPCVSTTKTKYISDDPEIGPETMTRLDPIGECGAFIRLAVMGAIDRDYEYLGPVKRLPREDEQAFHRQIMKTDIIKKTLMGCDIAKAEDVVRSGPGSAWQLLAPGMRAVEIRYPGVCLVILGEQPSLFPDSGCRKEARAHGTFRLGKRIFIDASYGIDGTEVGYRTIYEIQGNRLRPVRWAAN